MGVRIPALGHAAHTLCAEFPSQEFSRVSDSVVFHLKCSFWNLSATKGETLGYLDSSGITLWVCSFNTHLPMPVIRTGDTETTKGRSWYEENQKPPVNPGWAGFSSLNTSKQVLEGGMITKKGPVLGHLINEEPR